MRITVLFFVVFFSWEIGNAIPSYQENSLADLPLHVLESAVPSNLPVFVFISGDGGWNTFNESVCINLAQHGISVVALDSQKYFWKIKTPDQITTDMIQVIETYQKLWKRERFVLAGYSFGANIVPFVANRLPRSIKNNLTSIILVSPDRKGDFEIHLSDMLNLGLSKGKYDILQEIQQDDVKKYLIIFDGDGSGSAHQVFQQIGVNTEILEGNHHFDSGYDALARMILEEVKEKK